MTNYQELQMYKNFDELATDVLELAKEILPDQLIYLSSVSDTQQIILKLSNENTDILVTEGMVINLNNSLCNRIDFEERKPVIFEDTKKETSLADFQDKLEAANVRSYLGIPISLLNGEKFGTLCAINDEASHFNPKSIELLQRIVRMFSYYLNLERQAYRDELTDLYNRRYLSRFFEGYSKDGGGIFFLDLDGFKKVNDAFGHDEGDKVLKEVASRLQQFVARQEDAFAVRVGGDEFLIHVSNVQDREEMNEHAQYLIDSLNSWDAEYQLSASIGLGTYPVNYSKGLNVLLKAADEALYRAKAAGKNRCEYFRQQDEKDLS